MALGTGALLVLLGPLVLLEPVGQGEWDKTANPVQRRVASTLAGEPVRVDAVAVVPLFARVPSEAGRGWKDAPVWTDEEVSGRLIHEDGRFYLRVLNPGAKPVFVPAGTVFASPEGHEVYIARDAVVPAEFAALFPAYSRDQWAAVGADVKYRRAGIAPPLATGALLHPEVDFAATVLASWKGKVHTATYGRLLRDGAVQDLGRRLELASRVFLGQLEGTVVGAVFLVANRPVAAHVFGSHELFAAALPDLLHGVAVQAVLTARRVGGDGVLARLAQRGDARARALAFLRATLEVKDEWSESYGEGFDVVARNERDAVFGHAVVDARNQVFHVAHYALGAYWPGRKKGADPFGPTPPRPPDGGGNETPPGVTERKPRPSLSEQRRNDRTRPGR